MAGTTPTFSVVFSAGPIDREDMALLPAVAEPPPEEQPAASAAHAAAAHAARNHLPDKETPHLRPVVPGKDKTPTNRPWSICGNSPGCDRPPGGLPGLPAGVAVNRRYPRAPAGSCW